MEMKKIYAHLKMCGQSKIALKDCALTLEE